METVLEPTPDTVPDMVRLTTRPWSDARRAFRAVPGRLTDCEAELLYLLALAYSGRMLEVGHFLGRSTAAVCDAIRDSGRAVTFDSCDLAAADPGAVKIRHRRLYHSGFQPPETFFDLAFSQTVAMAELARRRIGEAGLSGYVNPVGGGFPMTGEVRYGFVFCDAMYEPQEVEHYLPLITAVSEDACTWAFHNTTHENTDRVLARPGVRLITRVDSLGIYHYRRKL